MTGPTPQKIPPGPGALGARKKLCVMSPRPPWLPSPTTSSWWMNGTMVREIRFQRSPSLIGMTGWTFTRYLNPLSSWPWPKSKLELLGQVLGALLGKRWSRHGQDHEAP
jgi:hypothetical protein